MNIWQRFTSCRQFLAAIFQNVLFPICMQTCCCITKTSYIMIASICGAVLNIVLNAVLIPLFGYQAAAYSMLIAFVFLSYVQMRVSKKLHFTITGTKETVYDACAIIGIQWLVVRAFPSHCDSSISLHDYSLYSSICPDDCLLLPLQKEQNIRLICERNRIVCEINESFP